MFYDSLSSYGSWFETPDYGYVWQPVVVRDSDWRPYTRGRWACSDRGWTWISDEPFGWATYHYGRWALLRGHGWVWVPGSRMGALLGFLALKVTATSAGRRCRRKRSPIAGTTGIPRWMSSSASARCGSISWKSATSAARSTGTACRFPETSLSSDKPPISPTSTSKTSRSFAAARDTRTSPHAHRQTAAVLSPGRWIAMAARAATRWRCGRESKATA